MVSCMLLTISCDSKIHADWTYGEGKCAMINIVQLIAVSSENAGHQEQVDQMFQAVKYCEGVAQLMNWGPQEGCEREISFARAFHFVYEHSFEP